ILSAFNYNCRHFLNEWSNAFGNIFHLLPTSYFVILGLLVRNIDPPRLLRQGRYQEMANESNSSNRLISISERKIRRLKDQCVLNYNNNRKSFFSLARNSC